MTKAHYEFLAWWLTGTGFDLRHVLTSQVKQDLARYELVHSLAEYLKGTNPSFDKERFINAALGKD